MFKYIIVVGLAAGLLGSLGPVKSANTAPSLVEPEALTDAGWTCSGAHVHGSWTTTCGPSAGGLGKTITVPEPATDEEREARDARVRAWEAFCQPKLVQDSEGVGRWTYAHKGCDTGRTQ